MSRSFPSGVHHAFTRIRKGHFWFESRREILEGVLRTCAVTASARSLEVGCGDGFLLDLLPGGLRIGVDRNLDDLRVAKETGASEAVAATCEALPFRAGFSLVAAFDVLEHLPDENLLLRQCRALLSEGGWLVVTVPAGPELFSRLDDFGGHYRRYDRSLLCETVARNGFEIVTIVPLFRVLWPLAWLNARIKRNRPVRSAADEYSVNRWMNVLLRALVRLEWRLFGNVRGGRGTSWLLVARAGTAERAGKAAE